MAISSRKKADERKHSAQTTAQHMLVIVCSILVATIATLFLPQLGIARTHDGAVLDCPYTGNAAHTHNEDCYDDEGNLVCPLEERELHTHTDACYEDQTTLVCGLDESEDHTHSDECYQTERVLICDKDEQTQEHVHGPECFTSPDDGDDSAAANQSSKAYGLEKILTASDGSTYEVTVSYQDDADVPEGADLVVSEITEEEDSSSYGEYIAKTEDALGWQEGTVSYARLLDIKIVDELGEKIEPAAPVDVRISLMDKGDAEPSEMMVVHFDDETDEPAVIDDATTEGEVVTFEAESFSVYAIVETGEPAPPSGETIKTLDQLNQHTDEDVYLSVTRSGTINYFTNTLDTASNKQCFKVTTAFGGASKWLFEPASAGNSKFRLYTMIDGEKLYVTNPSGNYAGLSDSDGAVFELSESGDGATFYLKIDGENKWLQYSGSGQGIRFWGEGDAENRRITITLKGADDPYELDGKTYGIAHNQDTIEAVALMGEVKDQWHLLAKKMTVRPDILKRTGVLLVAENSDITEWTFHSVEEDRYYLTTEVDGTTKYLTQNGRTLSLEDEPAEDGRSIYTYMPGTGEHAGTFQLVCGNYAVGLDINNTGTINGYWGTTTAQAHKWLNLVEKSTLTEDDFTQYVARKTSVSDTEQVYDGQQVIIYTRVWNEETKKYEFFVVDRDGVLILSTDAGDEIEWVGNRVNSALWDFTEYKNDDGTPNYYYELQNTEYDNYIAPQLTGDQVFSNEKIGINLNGRRDGKVETTIVAWDDHNYSYSGLKVEDGRVVACPFEEADDFYFAIVATKEPGEEGKLTTVNTIDNNEYGITMKMFDFNNPHRSERDREQLAFMGPDGDTGPGLLSTDLKEDGYPVRTSKGTTSYPEHSFAELIAMSDGATDANHLFLESVHNESGYFEYGSWQNFAHYNKEDGTFTVYDQLGAITGSNEHRNTREHGQFMPYDNIYDDGYAIDAAGNYITNETDVMGNPLPGTDARKGEKMYDLGKSTEVDYFFGMEMTAGFTQTESGLDDWGHDIIFEFYGDDDFWLYVDGELIVDLGGVHSAQEGSVNFRTGEIKSTNGNSTLYETFRSNYETRGLPEAEIQALLDEKFTQNDDGQWVFKDYTTHSMKMLYMERGSGASNLYMRFSLASGKPNAFTLSKELSGEGVSPSNDLIEFPYQIWYKSLTDNQYHLLTEKTGETYNVLYEGTTLPVPFKSTFTPTGGAQEYQNVFLIKPGEKAEVTLPDDAEDYYVVECGVNPDVYDEVTVNGSSAYASSTPNMVGATHRKDYATGEATLRERQKVAYVNHVVPGAMRTVEFTKKLYDSDGQRLIPYPENTTEFSFRLYLGNEEADPNDLPAASYYQYYVKDGDGNYCRFDAGTQSFVSLGISDYASLQAYLDDPERTAVEREAIIFKTSMYGSISKIPADHTVEVRDLIVDTQYKIVERDSEIPRGYTRRQLDGYSRIDAGHEVEQGTPISDTIELNESPQFEIRNQKGWGLTVNKIWSDQDFVDGHDPIYFAVYQKEGEGASTTETLLDGSVRQLTSDKSSLYYYFDNLQSGIPFEDYIIREVLLGGDIVVDDDGVVTSYGSITPLFDGDIITVNVTPLHGGPEESHDYSVMYLQGEPTGRNENVRTDLVSNIRPGILFYKSTWDGTMLAGATFTLKDEQGHDVGSSLVYTSDDEGIITLAPVEPGNYTLTEIGAPRGYTVLDSPMTVTLAQDGTVSVSGIDESFYTVKQASPTDPTDMATITIKDRTVSFKTIKIDDATGNPLAGVHFALYREVTDSVTGLPRKDYLPLSGFDDLVTGDDGVVPGLSMTLLPATYYLTETQTVEGYELLTNDLKFTVGRDGTVTLDSGGNPGWLTRTVDDAGHAAYTLTIPNGASKLVSFKKVDGAHPDDSALQGAEFDLYEVVEGQQKDTPLMSQMISGEDGLLVYDEKTVFNLPIGTYHLIETKAPEGFTKRTDAIVVTITASGVENAFYDAETHVYTMNVSNSHKLPMTGAAGIAALVAVGVTLAVVSQVQLLRRQRSEAS